MRRISLVLGLVLLTGMGIHNIFEFVVINDGIHYFSSEPIRLVYGVLLGVAVGIVALGISRLSPDVQRNLKLFALGGFGLFLFGGAVFTGSLCYSMWTAPLLYDGASLSWVLVGFISAALAAGVVSWQFTCVRKQSQVES